jgi:3-isopropylmalate/(R)-2-methylmalate dehydratase small subunit
VDIEMGALTFTGGEKTKSVPFALKDFEKASVEAGGRVEYAAARY